MSIFYICGKPGSGKSYLGVKQIIEELSDPNSDRFIVTNIVLKLPEIAEWLHQNVKHEVNLDERIRILDDAEAGEFWLYEPHREFENRKTIQMRRRSYDVPDFEDRAERGTLYVIDEVHNYFGARDWQNTGPDATFFLSQHRKLLCDVIFITQHPEQTDKALRRLAQEYMSVRNLSREPMMGFNLASWFGSFRFVRSLNSPQSANPATFDSGFVDLQPEVYGRFYDTMQGVGIAGRVTPPAKHSRGRSLWWLFVPIGGFLVGLYLLFAHLGQINHAISYGLGRALFKGSSAMVSKVGLPVSSNAVTQPSAVPSLPASVAAAVDGAAPEIYCVGFCALPGSVIAWMSDGSSVTPADGLQKIERLRVWISGKAYPVRRAPLVPGGLAVLSDSFEPASVVAPMPPPSWSPLRPVNQVDLVPGVHGIAPARAPRLNGIQSMGRGSYGGGFGY